MWIPLLQSTPFPCPTLPLSPCPLLCAYYNTIFFRPSIILCVHENRVCSFFFVLFSAVFGFVFPAFSLHIFTAKQIFWQATDRNWQAHEQWTGKCMASTHKTDRDRDREMERGTPTNGLSVAPTDRQISVSVAVAVSSVRPQAEPFAMPACLPHVKDDSSCEKVNIQTRPFSHAESQSVPLSHCPSACRVSFVVQSYCQTLLLLLLLPHFPMVFQLERKEKCGLRTKTIVAKSTALLKEKERERGPSGVWQTEKLILTN